MSEYQLKEVWPGTAESYQDYVLPLVSRTFALTIPQLPDVLHRVVGNAYLLCRIADTIEDDAALDAADKRRYEEAFVDVVNGRGDAAMLAAELAPRLSLETIEAERDLVRQLPLVIQVLRGFSRPQQNAIERCVGIMSRGMHRFQQAAAEGGLKGLADQAEMDRYCYYVAGVVGEMLTELFCDFDPAMDERREQMLHLSVSFGQALQMTNILKDQWEDRARGACWLPRETFQRHGVDLAALKPGQYTPAYGAALSELVGVAHAHLRNALEYTLLIPAQHTGIRKFCLWASGLAALTLKNIHKQPQFTGGAEIKVSRGAVARTIMVTNVSVKRDTLLRRLFDFAWDGLPLAQLGPEWAPLPAAGDGGLVPALAFAGGMAGFAGVPRPVPPRYEFRGPLRDLPARPLPRPAVRPAEPVPAVDPLDQAIDRARVALMARQKPDGHWCFEFETDCTISAEYILMMHFLDEIDEVLQERLARYIRLKHRTDTHGGWPLYQDGPIDLSCTVKSYYALKAAGDSADAPHMVRAREVILAHGGAAKSNVFTRILLAMFEQVPWRAAPYVPVEIMLFPKWMPFHLDKVSYWARTTMVPLFILCSLKAKAKNPRKVSVRELFVTPPEEEEDYFPTGGFVNKLFRVIDIAGRACDPLIPKSLRWKAIRRAEAWFLPRMNGEDGLGGIFPPMVNALEVMDLLGYPKDHPARTTCVKSLQKLLVHRDDGTSFCQPCVSPLWDTGWAAMALLKSSKDEQTQAAVDRALEWLVPRQVLDLKGDWAVQAPDLAPGGWAFQYANGYYPDLDDTAMVAGLMHVAAKDPRRGDQYRERLERAADWLVGMQSDNGGFAAFDRNNTHYYINYIPFADHGAMLDPPTEDVSGRVLACLGVLNREQDRDAIRRCITYLRQVQQPDGSFWGRWGTNFIYGTWSVLAGLALVGEDLDQPWIRKAIDYLKDKQHADGGWGETNDSYEKPELAGTNYGVSTAHTTAWALLGLLAVGEHNSRSVDRGIRWLLQHQQQAGEHLEGLWYHPSYNAPGFPRVFYLKYHGYTAYFPLWALTRYRQLTAAKN
jgi:squalene-hopene/tetraprenyl-beta-curcumene cyclase